MSTLPARPQPDKCSAELVMTSRANKGSHAMEGWQPIGTAPRDGRSVLAYLPANAGHPTRQDVAAIFWAGAAGWETAYSGARVAAPTHWMPLPDPPVRPQWPQWDRPTARRS